MQTIGAFLDELAPLLPPDAEYSNTAFDFDGNSAPPAISVYPSSESYSPPTQPSRQPRKTDGRSIMTRRVTLIASLWGETIEATEELLRRFAVACREIATGPSIVMGGGQWVGARGLLKHGHVLSVTLTVDLALQADAPRTARPDEMTITHEVLNDAQG